MASMRNYSRARSTISLVKLQEIMKEHIAEPTDDWMEVTEQSLLIKLYLPFFVALGQETARVNGVAVAQSAESLWKLGRQKSHLFGTALEKAFTYAKRAGDLAVDGSKLTQEVRQVYISMTGRFPGEQKQALTPVKVGPGVKGEPVAKVKAELCQAKEELAQSSGSRCLIEP